MICAHLLLNTWFPVGRWARISRFDFYASRFLLISSFVVRVSGFVVLLPVFLVTVVRASRLFIIWLPILLISLIWRTTVALLLVQFLSLTLSLLVLLLRVRSFPASYLHAF